MKQGLKRLDIILGMFLSGVANLAHSIESNPIFLITAIKKAPAVIYPGQVETAIYSIKMNPKVPSTLYGNGLVGLPKGIKVVGGSCRRPVFNLAPGKSCTVELRIIADQLAATARGGPKVCASLINPVYCSLPPATSMLNIRKGTRRAVEPTLSVEPESIILAKGGGYQEIIITNNGPSDAFGVQVEKKPGLGVNVSGSCASPLAPKASCNLTLTSSSQAGITNAIIAGSNTNKVNEQITVISAEATTLSVTLSSPAPAVIAVNGSTGVKLSIKNTGNDTAYNVGYTLPSRWKGVSSTGTCAVLELNNTCTLTFKATKPNIADVIQLKAINSLSVPSPYIAFRYGGGLVFSVSGTSPAAVAKVVTEMEVVPGYIAWSNNYNNPTGAINPTNGKVNTDLVHGLIQGQGNNQESPANYAVAVCLNYNGDGSSNWYLPAICELSNSVTVGQYDCSNTENITTNLKDLGFGNIQNDYYWSSNESNFNAADAMSQAYNLNLMSADPKSIGSLIRCVRAITY